MLRTLFSSELQHFTNPFETLNYIHKKNLRKTFPNLNIALRILLTIPISVTSGERSFSRLKIIKNYLRSTMSQERLVNLSMITIENNICNQIEINDIALTITITKLTIAFSVH